MSKVYIPQDYHTPLSVYEMQRAIEFIKSNFQVNLSNALNLRRVSAPLFVDENSGLNDNLNGVERPVSFDIPDVGTNAQVVHSLAKWKRLALKRYDFKVGKGLFTDMNAIRRDEEVDNLHSVYVDQWDWEKVISAEDRNVAYLKRTVRDIVSAVSETSSALNVAFPSLHTKLPSEVFFITTQELEDLYPDLTPKQREDEICKKKGVVFLMQIGKILKSGIKHDGLPTELRHQRHAHGGRASRKTGRRTMDRACDGRAFTYVGNCFYRPKGTCTRAEGKPCRHPDLVRPSPETYEFDIVRTASELFGIELKWGKEGLLI